MRGIVPVIYVIHPDKEELSKLRNILQGRDFTVREFSDGQKAEAELRIITPDACLIPMSIDALGKQPFIQVLNKELPECPVIILAQKGQVSEAVRMIGVNSVFDYFLLNPIVDPIRLHVILDKALTQSIIQLNLEDLKRRLSQLPNDLPGSFDEQANILKNEIGKRLGEFKEKMKSDELQNVVKLLDEKAFDQEFDRFNKEQIADAIDKNRESMSESISSRLTAFNRHVSMQLETKPTIENLLELRRQIASSETILSGENARIGPSSKQELLKNLKKKILLFPENGYPFNTLIEMIENIGYSVHLAQSPRKMMELLRSQTVDMLICGYDLGDTTGIEVTKLLRANPNLKNLPVLLFTSNLSKEIEAKSREIGIQDILKVPFLPKTLEEKLSLYLKAG